jgi:hypothetical protein
LGGRPGKGTDRVTLVSQRQNHKPSRQPTCKIS